MKLFEKKPLDDVLADFENEIKNGMETEKQLFENFQKHGIKNQYVRYLQKKYAEK